MSDRKWPAAKIGSAWMTHDPDDGWYEYDNPSDAESAFGQIVDHLRDEAVEALDHQAEQQGVSTQSHKNKRGHDQ